MPLQTWGAFAIASLILAIAPGPDNIFVLMQSMIYGRGAGLKVIAGLCSGLVVQTALVAFGVAALIAASEMALAALKVAGALYLVYLAFLAWRAPIMPLDQNRPPERTARGFALWRRGLIMNLTNPKVVIFFLAFFPQFLTPGANTVEQMLIMGATFIAATVLVFGAIALCAGYVRQLFKSERAQRWINRSGAAVFVLLAANLLLVQ